MPAAEAGGAVAIVSALNCRPRSRSAPHWPLAPIFSPRAPAAGLPTPLARALPPVPLAMMTLQPDSALCELSPSPRLKRVEAESIAIIRVVAAEVTNAVMLYSIGKDSGVMLHLAMKAFYPSKLPFPLLHVDTAWKFREMILFRDEIARRYGLDLI